jgi:hypothetical protein
LRILHLSHESLPDWRIEKAAISALNNGHHVAFAGLYPKNYTNKTFSEIYNLAWTAKARFGIPFYWHSVKKQLEKIIRQARPDIVHAHNIFSAKMISEFDIPFVYDDHEYWSMHSKLLIEMESEFMAEGTSQENMIKLFVIDLPMQVRRKIRNRYIVHLLTNWEKEIVSSRPTITVSDKIADELGDIANNTNKIFVVPNFPRRCETKDFQQPSNHIRLSSAYAGGDGISLDKYPNRNIDGLIDLFVKHNIGDFTIVGWKGKPHSSKISYSGFLSRASMLSEMFKHSIGLIPFKKHWSHPYLNPNKAYNYAHAGLFVGCTSSLETVLRTLKDNCISFEDYNDLVTQLEYFRDNLDELYNKRLKIFEFARNNLIWENHEKNIFRAYQLS